MMKKKLTRWALHREGTTQLGYLCKTKQDADQMLEDLSKAGVAAEEAQHYKVVEVEVSFDA